MQEFSLQGLAALGVAVATIGCVQEPYPSQTQEMQASARPASAGLVRLTLPDQDPGPPFYARLGVQFYEADGWIAIPFYRPPQCVPSGFNLLEFYHFPGPMGPGAFGCPLLQTGHVLTEGDAPLGTFPRSVVMEGTGIPVWFVRAADLAPYRLAGSLTMPELEAMHPLKGVADRYHETLHPRDGDHRVIINTFGQLADGRRFAFNVTDIDFVVRAIGIRFR